MKFPLMREVTFAWRLLNHAWVSEPLPKLDVVNREHCNLRKCLIRTKEHKVFSSEAPLRILKASVVSWCFTTERKLQSSDWRKRRSTSQTVGWWVSTVDTWAVQLLCKVNIDTSAESSYQATCSSPAESEKQLESAWQMQTADEPRNEIHPATATGAAASYSEPRPHGKVTLVQVDSAEGEASTL